MQAPREPSRAPLRGGALWAPSTPPSLIPLASPAAPPSPGCRGPNEAQRSAGPAAVQPRPPPGRGTLGPLHPSKPHTPRASRRAPSPGCRRPTGAQRSAGPAAVQQRPPSGAGHSGPPPPLQASYLSRLPPRPPPPGAGVQPERSAVQASRQCNRVALSRLAPSPAPRRERVGERAPRLLLLQASSRNPRGSATAWPSLETSPTPPQQRRSGPKLPALTGAGGLASAGRRKAEGGTERAGRVWGVAGVRTMVGPGAGPGGRRVRSGFPQRACAGCGVRLHGVGAAPTLREGRPPPTSSNPGTHARDHTRHASQRYAASRRGGRVPAGAAFHETMRPQPMSQKEPGTPRH